MIGMLDLCKPRRELRMETRLVRDVGSWKNCFSKKRRRALVAPEIKG
jgi:hypothetical protein